MAMTVQCDIVSAEQEIFSGLVEMLVAKGTYGELGISYGHAPLLTGIEPGPIRVKKENGEEDIFFVSGGYIEVQPNVITVLADTALRESDLDEAAALEAKSQAEQALKDQPKGLDYSKVAARLAEASAQLRTLQAIRKKHR